MKLAAAAALLLFVVGYVMPAGVLPLTSPDETRYAEIPREMIASGDWVVPRLDGLRYFEKPPLGYWLTALSIQAFGENRFAVRFPSAVSVGLTAMILLALVTRLSGKLPAGLLAASVYLTFLLVFAVGSIALLDNPLTLFVTGTLGALLCALQEQRLRRRAIWLGLGGLCCGLAFLTKGFLAVALPGMVVPFWVVLERRWKDALKIAWVPLLVALAVVLPWGIAIHLREPDYWRYFFWVEHVGRFLGTVGRSQHPEPAWFFVPILVGGIWPWLPMLPAAMVGCRSESIRTACARFVLPWLVLPFAFFSAASGKLPTYILPCFPALAMLMGMGLTTYFERERRPRLFLVGSIIAALGGVAAVLAIATQGRPYYDHGESWKWILALGLFAAWSLAALVAGLANTRARIHIYSTAPLLFMLALRFLYPQAPVAGFEGFLQANASDVAPTAIVVTDSRTVQATCWHLKRSDLLVVDPWGEVTYGLGYPDASHRKLDVDDVLALLTANSRTRDVLLVLGQENFEDQFENVLAELPQLPERRAQGSGLVLLQYGPDPAARGSEP